MSVTATRIYQAKINASTSRFEKDAPAGLSVVQALGDTHDLFQDAVNYHLVALAGMVSKEASPDTVAGRFRSRVESIWTEHPKGNPRAKTLQQSLARSLNLTYPSFEEAVTDIFEGGEAPKALPKVFDYIIFTTAKGEGVIQQQGNELLPKLCNPDFGGSFALTTKMLSHDAQKEQLITLLDTATSEHSWQEIYLFAKNMSLGDVGVKLNDKQYTPLEEVKVVNETVDELFRILFNKSNAKWHNALVEYYKKDNYEAELKAEKSRCLSLIQGEAQDFFCKLPQSLIAVG